MFASGSFSAPPPPRTPIQNNRLLGAIVLLVAIILCLALVVGIDTTVLIPFNATYAITQTWQAANPDVTPQFRPTRRSPRNTTPTPSNFDMQARANRQES
ncbi:MAG: hypothetical protein ABI947_25940 [Chloroflexota bacterium]